MAAKKPGYDYSHAAGLTVSAEKHHHAHKKNATAAAAHPAIAGLGVRATPHPPVTPRNHDHAKPARAKLRARLRHAALTHAPVFLTGGRLARVRENSFVVTQRLVPIARLPQQLHGLRIVHLSDLHIGKLITPAHLPAIIQSANDLKPDLIAVTGDFVDLSVSVLPHVIDAIKQLRARLGVYCVPGNHDYLDNGPELIRQFHDAHLNLLMNQTVQLTHEKCTITIAGIDWAMKRRALARLVKNTLQPLNNHSDKSHVTSTDENQLRLLLAHHPDAFDFAVPRDIDLTLSGHTHGGQLVLKRPGKHGAISLGRLAFKYPQGIYRKNDSVLHVTTGVGSWFPLRVRCAAEIALLTLQCPSAVQ